MECPNCGGQMGLEDAFCPYCSTPNAQAAKHQSDMARFRREFRRTQADVTARTTLMQRSGSWLVIMAVLLAALVVGIVLQVNAWDIGYSIRQNAIQNSAAQDAQAMDDYLEQGDYGQFLGYYEANDITMDYENPYQGLYSAVRPYVDLVGYISAMNNVKEYQFKPDYVTRTCEYLAEDIMRIYTFERQYSYDLERYLPADKQVYVEDIRDRTAAIAKTYFGLTDEQIQGIPDMSEKKLATLIEEGIAS